MKRLIYRFVDGIWSVFRLLSDISSIRESLGRIESRLARIESLSQLRDREFKVYSQWGDDGIIQYLTERVPIARKVFVEFGVEDYSESNTRFLLVHQNWSGLIFDSSAAKIGRIRRSKIYWQHDLRAATSFITRENIDELLVRHGLTGDVGLLSIDIDGNDYWVWEAVSKMSPRIVVIEYNSRLGSEKAITIPYSPDFTREKAHYSMIYFGASLNALIKLGIRKGYSFVGCNSAGINAYFVRQDIIPSDISSVSVGDGYVRSKVRETRDGMGQLAYLTPEEEEKILDGLPWVEV